MAIITTYSGGSYNATASYVVLGRFGGFGGGLYAYSPVTITNYGTLNGRGARLYGGGSVFNGADSYQSGTIGGGGVFISGFGTVSNYSVIAAAKYSEAIVLQGGGIVINGAANARSATLSGYTGVQTFGYTTLTNFGAIEGLRGQGVSVSGGGRVTNGAVTDTSAAVAGYHQGVVIDDFGTLMNFGTVSATGVGSGDVAAVVAGGVVTNGSAVDRTALMSGYAGVASFSYETVTNFGEIEGFGAQGVFLSFGGGRVVNGSATDTTAEIYGYNQGVAVGGFGSVINFGTVTAAGTQGGDMGVSLSGSGAVINGSAVDRTALISGYGGVGLGGGGLVVNYGSIRALGGDGQSGVSLGNGGAVVNGSFYDRSARIEGDNGVGMQGAYGTVRNYGTIVGAAGAGISLTYGGKIVNGPQYDLTALITGGVGVELNQPGVVMNYGTIVGSDYFAVALAEGGVVYNGHGADRSALLSGFAGVFTYAVATVFNSGTIDGTKVGAALLAGGSLTNGSLNNATALMEGYYGAGLYGPGSGTNYGIIEGLGDDDGEALRLGKGSAFTNGAQGHGSALIDGFIGVLAPTATTLINFGTIAGGSGVAVQFEAGDSLLVVEAGSVFEGQVLGGGGRLDLASGVGTVSAANFATITVSGSMPATVFSEFAVLSVGAAAAFTLAGSADVAKGERLGILGALTAAGTIESTGSVALTGTLAGAGALDLAGGSATFASGSDLSIAAVTQSGGTATFGAGALAETSTWVQTGGTIATAAKAKTEFLGVGDVFEGVLGGPGEIDFAGGSDAITGAALSAAHLVVDGAAVTLAGTINLGGALAVTASGALDIDPSGATLTGGGSVTLAALSTVAGVGVLTNGVKILGAGDLGDGSAGLDNLAAGVIDANAASALVIDAGAGTVDNAGLVESTGSGGVVIASALDNTGKIYALAGVITAEGAVTGAGVVRIGAGKADFTSSFNERVAFLAGATGVLELSHSQAYTAAVSGFSLTGATALDLDDIAFGASTKASFAGTSTSGVLTVTDGTHTAKIRLIGNFLSSVFNVASDGHGGTTVTDPAKVHAATFVAAMASMPAARAATAEVSAGPLPPAAPATLAVNRFA